MSRKDTQKTPREVAPRPADSARPRELTSPEQQVGPESAPRHRNDADRVDMASMDSFPCSDPPGYYPIRS